jgi:hypothetical protein
MRHAEVLIVGGGPAGSTCAWALRRAGMNVAVLDQAEFPRDKVCAGWITPAVLQSLEIDVDDYAREQGIQPIRGFRVGLMNKAGDVGKVADIRHHATVSYGIRRREFDDYLLRRSGARLFSGEPARSLRREGREWRINDIYAAPMLVGAGGHACPVARLLGAHHAGEAAKASAPVSNPGYSPRKRSSRRAASIPDSACSPTSIACKTASAGATPSTRLCRRGRASCSRVPCSGCPDWFARWCSTEASCTPANPP